MDYKTRANGVVEFHDNPYAVREYVRRQPSGTRVKVYKQVGGGYQLQETVTAEPPT